MIIAFFNHKKVSVLVNNLLMLFGEVSVFLRRIHCIQTCFDPFLDFPKFLWSKVRELRHILQQSSPEIINSQTPIYTKNKGFTRPKRKLLGPTAGVPEVREVIPFGSLFQILPLRTAVARTRYVLNATFYTLFDIYL